MHYAIQLVMWLYSYHQFNRFGQYSHAVFVYGYCMDPSMLPTISTHIQLRPRFWVQLNIPLSSAYTDVNLTIAVYITHLKQISMSHNVV